MKESIIDKILCSTGYLPPRNEEEMNALAEAARPYVPAVQLRGL